MNLPETTNDQSEIGASLSHLKIDDMSSGMKTVRVHSNHPNLPNIDSKPEMNAPATGLVRRLSVTARPGDIFYKVKDVTESSSTTDNYEQVEPDHNVEQEIIIKPKNEEVNTNTWRKTTTWNVKRTQSTPLQSDSESGRQTPKNEPDKTSLASIEPGSPMFTKELLSIRYVFLSTKIKKKFRAFLKCC
jgi:hypothetical protein